jgi:hypothetical protein
MHFNQFENVSISFKCQLHYNAEIEHIGVDIGGEMSHLQNAADSLKSTQQKLRD